MGQGNRRQAIREERRARQQRQQMMTRAMIVIPIVLVVAGVAYLIWASLQPPEGAELWEEVAAQEGIHIESGDPYEPYNTDPPNSGYHFGEPMQPAEAGLYEEDEIIPDENLVHSLEHGYVIIWYDCSELAEDECDTLKDGIDNVIDRTGTYKVVGMPRAGMDQPIVLTSWGMIFRLDELDEDKMVTYIEENREKNAPEPEAP